RREEIPPAIVPRGEYVGHRLRHVAGVMTSIVDVEDRTQCTARIAHGEWRSSPNPRHRPSANRAAPIAAKR
ncbi:hypothetical protein, partial [Burkholderia multivorans]|uniref:hypothetical protein n=1 Tax=Burkholderia multivorans TaxID=87883 RepID=UPI0021C1EA1D